MAIVDNYTTQDMRNLIFKFYPGTYTPPKFGDVTLNWAVRPTYSSVGNIQATITALGDGPYHDYTYTYLKYCTTYVVGYGVYGVQILKQRCVYGGVRDLSGFIGMHAPADLPAFIYGTLGNVKDLSGFIDTHPPADLPAYLKVFLSDYGDLPSSIHGWVEKDLPAYIRAVRYQGLPAFLNPVPPSDLPAYLKVWPMEHLPSYIYGWDIKDLAARINAYEYKDLPVYIDMHPWVNLPVYPLRVWAREVPVDLPAFLRALIYEDLPVIPNLYSITFL
jgi:hypothetical protein